MTSLESVSAQSTSADTTPTSDQSQSSNADTPAYQGAEVGANVSSGQLGDGRGATTTAGASDGQPPASDQSANASIDAGQRELASVADVRTLTGTRADTGTSTAPESMAKPPDSTLLTRDTAEKGESGGRASDKPGQAHDGKGENARADDKPHHGDEHRGNDNRHGDRHGGSDHGRGEGRGEGRNGSNIAHPDRPGLLGHHLTPEQIAHSEHLASLAAAYGRVSGGAHHNEHGPRIPPPRTGR